MVNSPRFWSWSPVTSRWLSATEVGSRLLFTEQGREAAYGRRPPARPGMPHENYPPLLRADQWDRFAAAVASSRSKRHRILPV